MIVCAERRLGRAAAVPTRGIGRLAADSTGMPANEPSYEVRIDSLTTDEWDNLATEFDDLTYDQVARFANGQWGAHRMSNLVLRRHGLAVAGIQLAVLMVPGVSRGLAYGRFGPIWRRRNGERNLDIYRAVIAAIIEEYCIRRGHYLTLIPRPNPQTYSDECRVLHESGFRVRRPFDDRNRYLVNSLLEESAQLKSIAQKWRYNLKQARKNDIEIRLGESERDIVTFMQLHAMMVARKRFYDADPLHLIPELRARLPEPLRPRIVLALHDDRPIAGAVIALLGDTAFYVFGASDDRMLPLKGGYALQWWIIRWLHEQGVRWYDLGGEALEPGLRQFKKGFVGRQGSIVDMIGEFDYWEGVGGRMVADAIYMLREFKRAVRHILYRH